MGPIETAIRDIIENDVDHMEALSGVSQASPRFPMAGIVALVESYIPSVQAGDVSEELAQDYLGAVYAILGAHSVATMENPGS